MKTVLIAACMSLALSGGLMADDSIRLSSGTTVKLATFEFAPNWRTLFPEDRPFFADKHPSGSLRGMHARDDGKPDGASVSLDENGKLKILATYDRGLREGPVRMWDEDQRMLFYGEYDSNRKHGITCLFQNGEPWLIQEWKRGELDSEGIFTCLEGKQWKRIDNPQQLAEARRKVADAERALKEDETEIRQNLRDWFEDLGKRVREQNARALKSVRQAQAVARTEAAQSARIQAERAQAAAMARSSRNPYVRKYAAARAAGSSASHDAQAAQRHAAAAAREAEKALSERNASLVKELKDLYAFAMTALEKTDHPPHAGSSAKKERRSPKESLKSSKTGKKG